MKQSRYHSVKLSLHINYTFANEPIDQASQAVYQLRVYN